MDQYKTRVQGIMDTFKENLSKCTGETETDKLKKRLAELKKYVPDDNPSAFQRDREIHELEERIKFLSSKKARWADMEDD